MSENWRQSEICIAINDKSQGSTAKHLSYDELLHYKFIIQFAGERLVKIGDHLEKLRARVLCLVFLPHGAERSCVIIILQEKHELNTTFELCGLFHKSASSSTDGS